MHANPSVNELKFRTLYFMQALIGRGSNKIFEGKIPAKSVSTTAHTPFIIDIERKISISATYRHNRCACQGVNYPVLAASCRVMKKFHSTHVFRRFTDKKGAKLE